MCRLCFVDVEEARRQEQSLALTRSDIEGGEEASRIIMCDTMRPPEAAGCSDKCGRKKDTVSEYILRACPMKCVDSHWAELSPVERKGSYSKLPDGPKLAQGIYIKNQH